MSFTSIQGIILFVLAAQVGCCCPPAFELHGLLYVTCSLKAPRAVSLQTGSERFPAMLQLVNAIIVIALAAFAMFAYEHGNLVPNREYYACQQATAARDLPVSCLCGNMVLIPSLRCAYGRVCAHLQRRVRDGSSAWTTAGSRYPAAPGSPPHRPLPIWG